MQNYLEPVEDGLPMRASGPWVAEKLDYLQRYIEIFETSMRKKWHKRHFIDLFAGPGKCRTESSRVLLGSPLLALMTSYPFTDYFFVELDHTSIETLRTRCSASPLQNQIRFIEQDSNQAVHKIIAEIQSSDRGLGSASLNLAFLDPEGLELEWDTIAALAQVAKMDLIIHYPVMGLKRMLEVAAKRDDHAIDLFFGDKAWRLLYRHTQNVSVVDQELLLHYKQKLENLGYVEVIQDDVTLTEPAIKNTKQGLLYRLLFASKNPLGDKFWKQVIQRNVHGQRRLF